MKFSNIFRYARLITVMAFLLATFANCAEEPKKQAQEPTDPDPDPDTVEVVIPDIAPAICDFELDEDSLVDAGWTKAFEDNFTGDLSKWTVWNGGAFNNELQLYRPSNIKIEDGVLFIESQNDTVQGPVTPWDNTQKEYAFTSGRLESKDLFSASNATPRVRMMARIKLPAGYGLWPAFWCYGDPWPTQGEIDILEFRGQDPKKYQTNYFYGTQAGTNLVQSAEGFIVADADLTTCYHVYELIWEDDKLTSLLDGTIVEIKKSGGYINNMFNTKQKLTLNLAVGGLFFSNLDPTKIEMGTMEIDWVKVYTAD